MYSDFKSIELCGEFIHNRYGYEFPPIANSFLRHSYAFSLPTVSLFHPNVYSFHRGVSFFPPWWKESFPVMESNFLHGGKNKYLLQFSLTVAAKRDKSGDVAA